MNKPPRLTRGADRDRCARGMCRRRSPPFRHRRNQGGRLRGRSRSAVHDRKGYLAGDEKRRALELKNFFQRSDIDGIFCARGGFGSIQLLPHLNRDLSRISKNICRLQRYNNFDQLVSAALRHGDFPCADGGDGSRERVVLRSRETFLGNFNRRAAQLDGKSERGDSTGTVLKRK